ncbi:hypothetical protein K491DRAFT_778508 [Lophiostoma macrostomum CBS 122681]|uniref:Zn(2)-C6 fungal-type domain-containing protein n=1 Tax=Lophiostoma macrostomum CBS 122681 TaxID=1314788 RepID=A0A6A6T7N0_9PLEO|nr:hypothetical protein K491DRAFT_778508 [Lophiostoma macrostomum CBS 122681]
MNGGTRKSHTKSRNGCSQCKRARVKCSGQAPKCSRCGLRNLECDFADERTRSRILRLGWTHQSLTLPSLSPLPLAIEQQGFLQHFVESTSNSLITHDIKHFHTSRSFWRVEIPREALRCDYLLSSILALSAIHKTHLLHASGHLTPHTSIEHDINRSLRLHQASVSQFTASVPAITRENIMPALALAALSAVYSCALAQLLPALTPTDHVDQAISVLVSNYKALRLFRGHKPWLGSSGIEIEDRDGPDMVYDRGKRNGLDLAMKARKLRIINDSACDDEVEKAMYDVAITAFLDIHAHWTLKIPAEFMDCVQQKKPMALLVLNVFVVQVEEAEIGEGSVPWFMTFWKEGLKDCVSDHLGSLWTDYCELEVQ